MARRRRSLFRMPRMRWHLRLILLAILGLTGYFGKGTWNDLNAPRAGRTPTQITEPSPSYETSKTHSSPADASQGERVLVQRVVDGDTLVISGGDRVRLIGVDTPETHHPTKPPQPFGQEAFAFTRRMAEG